MKRGPYKGRAEYCKGYKLDLLVQSGQPRMAIDRRDYKQKIKDNVDIDEETGCWLWKGSKNNLGYGFICYKGQGNQLVHRVAYMEFVGPINGPCVRHKCDVSGCCNPDHLTTGSYKQNTADMLERGRGCLFTK